MEMNEEVWAYSNTGMKLHAFTPAPGRGYVALCRKTIVRGEGAHLTARGREAWLCPNCNKKFLAAVERAQASMEPATEVHDLGGVAPVDVAPEEPKGAREFYVGDLVVHVDMDNRRHYGIVVFSGEPPKDRRQASVEVKLTDGTVRPFHPSELLPDSVMRQMPSKVGQARVTYRKDGNTRTAEFHVRYWSIYSAPGRAEDAAQAMYGPGIEVTDLTVTGPV